MFKDILDALTGKTGKTRMQIDLEREKMCEAKGGSWVGGQCLMPNKERKGTLRSLEDVQNIGLSKDKDENNYIDKQLKSFLNRPR